MGDRSGKDDPVAQTVALSERLQFLAKGALSNNHQVEAGIAAALGMPELNEVVNAFLLPDPPAEAVTKASAGMWVALANRGALFRSGGRFAVIVELHRVRNDIHLAVHSGV